MRAQMGKKLAKKVKEEEAALKKFAKDKNINTGTSVTRRSVRVFFNLARAIRFLALTRILSCNFAVSHQ